MNDASRAAALAALIGEHLWLTEHFMLDFFVDGTWAQLPEGWSAALETLAPNDCARLASPSFAAPASWPPTLRSFLGRARVLQLERQPVRPPPAPEAAGQKKHPQRQKLALAMIDAAEAPDPALLRNVKPKKAHEIHHLSNLIGGRCAEIARQGRGQPGAGRGEEDAKSAARRAAEAAADFSPGAAQKRLGLLRGRPLVVDVGCGQGYLARYLAYHLGLDVTGVEAESSHSSIAAAKVARMRKELMRPTSRKKAAASKVYKDPGC